MTSIKVGLNHLQHKQDTAKPFVEHIDEIRRRLLYIVAAIGLTTGFSYFHRNQLIAFLLWPIGKEKLYYGTPVGAMSFTFEICFLSGVMLASPVSLYHLWRFLEPAVPGKFQPQLSIWILASTLLALLGAAYGYAVSLPATLLVSEYFQNENLTPLLSASEYLTFVTRYILAFSLFFQLPLLILFTSLTGIVTRKDLIGYQRHSLVASCVVGAVLTPTPDLINQLLLAIPLFLLYEISLLGVVLSERISEKKKMT
ncbi:MAG: twin-arginine translocase subunit TatC [Caldilineaceae bacterium]|nr:twin-arginine translocase subunit TatC [Caldilineaceae bacterium]